MSLEFGLVLKVGLGLTEMARKPCVARSSKLRSLKCPINNIEYILTHVDFAVTRLVGVDHISCPTWSRG